VEQQSDLSGGNWVVSATYLKGVGLVRRNNEFHHFDVLGTAGVITDASGAVLSTNVYDAFGVSRYVSGNAQTQWRASAGYTEVEGLLANCYIVAELALGLALGCMPDGGKPARHPCDKLCPKGTRFVKTCSGPATAKFTLSGCKSVGQDPVGVCAGVCSKLSVAKTITDPGDCDACKKSGMRVVGCMGGTQNIGPTQQTIQVWVCTCSCTMTATLTHSVCCCCQ